jgi:AhpD family alkylhydroperoxidase
MREMPAMSEPSELTPPVTRKETIVTIPADRLSIRELAPRQMAALLRLEQSIELDDTLHNLIRLRASQINGCAFCLDMHWKDAIAAGERPERLYLLSAWRESRNLYSDAERAALALCEALTLVTERGVPDDVWETARAAFGDDGVAQLVFAIAAINVWNRLNVAVGTEPGHYQPGMFAEAA